MSYINQISNDELDGQSEEKHKSDLCKYESIKIDGITYLIRYCYCYRYNDKSHLANHPKRIQAEDGVELHVYDNRIWRCHYERISKNGVYVFRLVCYCPR